MFSTLFSAAALSLLAVRAVRADFSVNSTSFTQCQTTHIQWSGTSQPVNILLVPASSPCDDTLFDLGDHSKSSMSWNVSLPAGTELLISVEDANGEEAWSDSITVAPSDDASCLSAAQRAQISASASSTIVAAPSATVVSIPAPSSAGTSSTGSTSSTDGTSSSGDSSSSDGSSGLLGAANAGVGPSASGASPRALAPLAFVGTVAMAMAALL